MHSVVFRRLEKPLAILLVGLSLFLTGRMAFNMATHSLSTDEFGTVGSFSAKGPLHVATDYRAPKNHIFFNLLNSLLPARESLVPARVRALSILATVLTALVLVTWGAWRSRLLEASVLLALWSAAPQMLSLSMEARGYGFLGLFAVTSSLALLEFLRDPTRLGWLVALGLSVALGTYTVPGFLFFGGPLMLLLWATTRTRVTFIAGAATFGAILLLHAPILPQLLAAFTGFHDDKNESDFASLHGVLRAVKLYLFQADDWESWTLFLMLALAPFALKIPLPGERNTLRILAAASLACLAVLLFLRTPPLRVAAFSLLPLGLAGFLAIGAWLRTQAPPTLRPAACALVALFLTERLVVAAAASDFTPTEDWSLAGHAIDAAFPAKTHVESRRYAKYLRKTLPGAEARDAEYGDDAFAQGRLIVADAGNKWAGGSRFQSPPGLTRVAQWTIPGTIRDIVLTFRLPESAGLEQPPASLVDGRTDTGSSFKELVLRASPAADNHALVVLLDRPVRPRDLHGPANMLVAGNAVVVPLAPDGAEDIRLRTTDGTNLKTTEAWITR
jgi:hypothetical protein